MKHLRVPTIRGRSERGAAAVEMVLVLSVLLFLAFGVVDFGRLLNTQIKITEAAREGARAESFGEAPDARVDKVINGAATATDTACVSPSATQATVTVTYPFEFVTPVGALATLFGSPIPGTKTLAATAVMPCRV